MRIAVLSETDPVETRVAATPDMVKKYKNLGADVVVQAGACSYGEANSTAVNPACAAARKRSRKACSVKSQPRLAAKRGTRRL